MDTLNIKGFKLNLNFEPQTSKNGRPIRHSGVKMNGQVPAKWIDGMYRHHWIYSFRYLDNDEIINFEFDYFDKFVGVVK
jgi:hypothetical protein